MNKQYTYILKFLMLFSQIDKIASGSLNECEVVDYMFTNLFKIFHPVNNRTGIKFTCTIFTNHRISDLMVGLCNL